MSDDPESLKDIDEPVLSKAAVDAHEWFNEECDMPVDIFNIINRCFKVVKKDTYTMSFQDIHTADSCHAVCQTGRLLP
jgi:hypothetical protein